MNGIDTSVSLPIRFINPHNGKSIKTNGLIDTGASDCAMPADLAKILGLNLKKSVSKEITTGNGIAIAYGHKTTIEIFHPEKTNEIIYKLENVVIDFMPCINIVLLGVNGFLSEFSLSIDYPNQTFSLIR